ncbi:MAG: response regulator, partial [Desulfatitalea sp.]
ITAGREWKGELHNRKKNGELYWESAAISPIRDNSGSITHFIAIKEDITEQKRIEAKLRENELIQRTLMNSLPIGLFIIDSKTRKIELINPTAAELLGAPPEAIVGRRCHQCLCPAQESACPILDLNQRVDNSDRMLLRSDGSKLPVLKTVNRIVIQGEEKLLECVIDISSRLEAERALKEAIIRAEELAQKAEAANRSKSIFLANMSHEIRTPLNAILGYCQLLQQDKTLGSEHRIQVRTINRSGDHLLELINGILEMSKIEAGHVQILKKPMDVSQLLDDIQAIFQLACQKKNIYLKIESIADLPVQIFADHGKVRQILINLISNAVKFTNQGGVTLSAAAQPAGEHQWALTFEVGDTGSGVAPEDHDRLFEAFEQTATGQQMPGGTGLGLPISQAYAQAMGGGLILVRSDLGQGSLFRFTFSAEEDTEPRGLRSDSAGAGKVIRLAPIPINFRVLVVEDDINSRRLLRQLLRNAGFEVNDAESGEAALENFEAFAPQLVLLDIRLPGIDGYETARRLRCLAGGAETKIIIVTASGVSSDRIRQRMAAAGIDGYIPKPYKTAELLEEIKVQCKVTYLYQEIDDDGPHTGYCPSALEIQQLPHSLQNGLKHVVEMGDMVAFARLNQEVAAINEALSIHLGDLAQCFDYSALLELLTTPQSKERFC